MRRLARAAALTLALAPLAAAAPSAAAPGQADPTASEETSADKTTAAATTAVSVNGHGWGHGRGMGQFGSYGYAKDHGWSWQQITDHFYGGTSLGTHDNVEVDVLLKAYGTGWTVAFVERGDIVIPEDEATNLTGTGPTAPHAVAIEWLGGNQWRVYEGDSCSGMAGGPFVERSTITAEEVVLQLADPTADERVEFLAACVPDGSGHRYYRGQLIADAFSHATDSTVRQRTMNRVPVESYLRSVVPAESPSSWGGDGTAPGMHALRSQAVAARSYVLAGDTRYGTPTGGRPRTCDDIFCQVYKGYGLNAGGTVTVFESNNTNLAVEQTAGQVRRTGAGGVARTEFSSSTGGYTAGGAFPAVEDLGDGVSSNPNHNWASQVPIAELEAAFDAREGRDLGAFIGFSSVERNGLGGVHNDGGRVIEITVQFANGSVEVTGNTFRSMFSKHGVKSDWFTPSAQTGPGGFSDTAGDPHAENIAKIAEADIAGGYPDGTFKPNLSVSRGQMATFLKNGYALPPGSSGTFTDTDGDTHEASIEAVAAAGIASGYPDGTYRPTQPITRGQMAVFLANAEDLEPVDGTGGLCDIEGHPFEGQIRAIVAAGIASGAADGCYHPDDPVTRGQMATFLVRALGL